MYLKMYLSEELIDLDSLPRPTYVIENKQEYYKICKFLFSGFVEDKSFFGITMDKIKYLDMDIYCMFIPNIFDLNLNSKRNINALYKLLKNMYYDNLKNDIDLLQTKAKEIVSKISLDFDIELVMNNTINEDDLFKAMDLRFSDDDNTPVAKFIKFVLVSYELTKIRTFFVLNLHSFFETDELNAIYHDLDYKKITIVDIETTNNFSKSNNESIFLIDKDLCLII